MTLSTKAAEESCSCMEKWKGDMVKLKADQPYVSSRENQMAILDTQKRQLGIASPDVK